MLRLHPGRTSLWYGTVLCGAMVAWLAVGNSWARGAGDAGDVDAGDVDAAVELEEPLFDWLEGPATGRIGDMAEIDLPEGYGFLGAADTRKLMELTENPVSGRELATLAPDNFDWFVVFEFDESGYVSDVDADDLDADALLSAIREGTEASNDERRQRGWATMEIVGWQFPPNYDPKSNNLQWAIRAKSEGNSIMNYNTRLLGRTGVMEATLVASPENMSSIVPVYKDLLADFHYLPGYTYGEFRAGDKVAEYGLAALVAGGGVAVAAKTGFLAKLAAMFAKLGKGLIVLVLAGLAALKAFFSRIFGRGNQAT